MSSVRALLALTGVGCLSMAACNDHDLLDTGDVLTVVLEPPRLFVRLPMDNASQECNERGGAGVRVLGLRSDGTSAKDVGVQLWLSGDATVSLTVNHVTLDEHGTDVSACVLPGDVPGSSVLHARSGAIQATADLAVLARAVPAAGSLVLSVSPVGAPSTMLPSVCGQPAPAACFPGRGRRASVAVQGVAVETSVVPDAASLTLSTDVGWLSAGSCLDGQPSASLELALNMGTAQAFVCLPDSAVAGTLTARSGSVTSMTALTAPAFVQSLELFPNKVDALPEEDISLSLFASDCEGRGVADVPVGLRVTTGAFDFGSTGAVVRTGRDGAVDLVGRALRLPLAFDARLLGTPAVSCTATIEAAEPEDAAP